MQVIEERWRFQVVRSVARSTAEEAVLLVTERGGAGTSTSSVVSAYVRNRMEDVD